MAEDFRRRGFKLPPSRSERDAADNILRTLLRGAENVQRGFRRPDDDWHPVWLVVTAAGQGTVFTGNEHKHKLTRRVGAFGRKVGAVAIGHLHSSWGIYSEDGISVERMHEIARQMERRGGSSEGIPERREMLLVQIHTATSWAEHRVLIDRHPDAPPTLRAPELMHSSETSPGAPGGPMVDPLRAALARLG